jgi:beta-glucosidase
VWFPPSPLKAVAAQAGGASVQFDSGANPAEAAELARKSDVAVVFVYQWTSEDFDLPNLALSENQDALIEQVAAANPHTIVVLETGSAVTMPWAGKVGGILEAWYAGSKGADAVANVLFGDVNPSGKLPITFPRSEQDMPHPAMTLPTPEQADKNAVMKTGEAKATFEVHYDEGLKVGYKWYDAEHKEVLFPFGFGLSYTTFGYSGLKLASTNGVTVNFTLKNTGKRQGMEIAEVYASLPKASGEPPKRLVGWSKVSLQPGESRDISLTIDPRYLSIYDEQTNSWKLLPGEYTFSVGGSSQNLPLHASIQLK